jgi:hypothetical protein
VKLDDTTQDCRGKRKKKKKKKKKKNHRDVLCEHTEPRLALDRGNPVRREPDEFELVVGVEVADADRHEVKHRNHDVLVHYKEKQQHDKRVESTKQKTNRHKKDAGV